MALQLNGEVTKYLFFEEQQENAIFFTVRVASGMSIAGCLFVFITFASSNRFRKPINRLLFYATIGNMFMAVASMISFAGIYAGRDSALCQTQGFLVQWFFPADAVWNLAMAINVYLTVFKHFDARRLRRLEWLYNGVSYGLTFVVALVYCFISTPDKGKMYGPAVLYCWVSAEWDVFRIALCYGPAWFAIVMSIIIYMAAGSSIYRKRAQLRLFRGRAALNRTSSVRSGLPTKRPHLAHRSTTNQSQNINKTTEVKTSYSPRDGSAAEKGLGNGRMEARIEAQSPRRGMEPVHPTVSAVPTGRTNAIHQANTTIKANAAAWGYTKVALLFFACLMITWVPSTLFRLYSVLDPTKHSFVLAYIAGLVIPLQGFWNFIIYVVTSWDAVQGWFVEDLFGKTRKTGGSGNGGGEGESRADDMVKTRTLTMTTQASVETMRDFDFGPDVITQTKTTSSAPSPALLSHESQSLHPQGLQLQVPPPATMTTTHETENENEHHENDREPKWVAMPYWGQSRETSPTRGGVAPRSVPPRGAGSYSPHLHYSRPGTRTPDATSSAASASWSAGARSPATLVADRASDEILSPDEARVFAQLPGERL